MKKLLFLILAALLLLTACSPSTELSVPPTIQSEDTAPDTSTTEPTPVQEDFGLSYLPSQGLNPYDCAATVNRALFSLLYESLFVVTNQFRAEPLLCQSFRVSNEGTAYTFTLVDGVKFSDGTPMTAADVAASIEAARTSPLYRSRLADLSYYTANEDGTFTIVLTTAYENFALMLDIPIVKADTVKDTLPIGTGPYYLSAGKLLRSPHWWQTQVPVLNAEVIHLNRCTTTGDLRDNFEFGATDLVYCDPNSAASAGYRCDYEVWDAPTTVMHYLGFNIYGGYFSNDALRAAVTYAVNREAIANEVYGGFARASALPCSPNSDLYDPRLAERYDYAPESFSSAVRESGVLTEYADYTGKLLVCSEDTHRVTAAERIAEVLQNAGLKITVEAVDFDSYIKALSQGSYDLYYGEVRLTANFDLREFFSGNGDLNYGAIADSALADLCTSALENSGNYSELCAQVMERAPICPVVFKSYAVYAARGRVEAIQPAVDYVFHRADSGRTLAEADLTYQETTSTEETDASEDSSESSAE